MLLLGLRTESIYMVREKGKDNVDNGDLTVLRNVPSGFLSEALGASYMHFTALIGEPPTAHAE